MHPTNFVPLRAASSEEVTRLPDTMNALQLSAYNGLDALEVVQKSVPRPQPGQILVKVEAAAVNPSDLMFIRNLYGFSKPLPTVPGLRSERRGGGG